MKRALICTVVGHVDHGKSSILDAIRGTAVTANEAGKITQAIGASIIPLDTIQNICGSLLKSLGMKIDIPGLLFIDTPGHAAFTSLRKRGGSLADIAVLTIDINEGCKQQTIESIEILTKSKTPFIVAANKIDLIPGWQIKNGNMLNSINSQTPSVKAEFEKRLYGLVGELHKNGFESERFDRVSDYAKQIAIIPVSANTKEGIPELLMVMAGLAQKFLEQRLTLTESEYAKGTILEVKEEKGLGMTVDTIIYEGELRVNDTIVIGAFPEPIVTKVRALLEPARHAEMRDSKTRFIHVKSVKAAIGVKIVAPELDGAIAGMPIMSTNDVQKTKTEIKKEMESTCLEFDDEGVILKADTLGGLEALAFMFKEKEIPFMQGCIGKITKKDIIDAAATPAMEHRVIIGFNISICEEIINYAKEREVKIITSDVIYNLIEGYGEWIEELRIADEKESMANLPKPSKIQILEGYVFRQSNPAVVGVEVIAGTLQVGRRLMKKDGLPITKVKSAEVEKKNQREVGKGMQAAVSLDNVTVGRQINEGDLLYTHIDESDFKKLKKLKRYLAPHEVEVLREIADIQREKNPVWGMGG